jgi:hypothetical protein
MIPGFHEYRYVWKWVYDIYSPLFSRTISFVSYGLMGIACMLYLMSIITVALQVRLYFFLDVKSSEHISKYGAVQILRHHLGGSQMVNLNNVGNGG